MATVKELSQKYNYNQATICAWINKKLLPARVIKHAYHIDENKFKDLLESGKVQKPRGYYKRNRSLETYKHNKKHEMCYEEDLESLTADNNGYLIYYGDGNNGKSLMKEIFDKTYVIKYIEDFLKENYNKKELTPHDYDIVEAALKILKGE